jgi:iron complex transport system substrate-binding protein
LHSLRIDYIIVDPPDLEELFVSIAKIADATGKNKEADILIKGIKEQIYKIKKRLSNISDQDRPKVYLEIWHDPIMSAGRDSFVNDMIEKAGGVNITSGLGRSFSRVDPEWIIFSNPNVIILSYMKAGGWIKENFVKRIGWGRIDAVKNSRIYADINPDIILRPGPRVKEGLLELHKRFYEN